MVDITVPISLHKLYITLQKATSFSHTGLIVHIRFFFFFLADSDTSYMMNSSCKYAKGEPKDAAVPDGMCDCKDSFQ